MLMDAIRCMHGFLADRRLSEACIRSGKQYENTFLWTRWSDLASITAFLLQRPMRLRYGPSLQAALASSSERPCYICTCALLTASTLSSYIAQSLDCFISQLLLWKTFIPVDHSQLQLLDNTALILSIG